MPSGTLLSDSCARGITNAEFEDALNNKDNRLVILKVLSGFSRSADWDDLWTWGLNALWYTLRNHVDGAGQKFTTSLWTSVSWECMRQLRNSGKSVQSVNVDFDVVDRNFSERSHFREEMACLSEVVPKLSPYEQRLLKDRFFWGKTMTEISGEHEVSEQLVTDRINLLLNKIKELVDG